MKRTNKYGLTYYEKNDFTSSLQEMQRWETVDNQLTALFQILGNGVIDGWDIIASSGLTAVVTAGSGHVNFVAVESVNNTTVALTASSRNYIYAALTSDSYWTKNVSFSSSVFINPNDSVLLLGYVDTNVDTITLINTDSKTTLGFTTLVNNAIKTHRHIGGTVNPSPINLATDVQGEINQNNLPDLDADVIQAGTLDPDRIPILDHITKLSDQGLLTHAQLDEFVNTLSIPDQTTMGEVSTTNLLQLILAVKHIYPDIDEFLLNEIAFIPGISPDSYIDTINTTATVDTNPYSLGGTHTISGANSTGFTSYSRIWETEDEFSNCSSNNTLVTGDSVELATKEDTLVIEEFDDISTWSVEIQDLSSIPALLSVDPTTYVVPPNSAKLNVGGENVQIVLRIKKLFDAQDWSSYNYLKFYIKTTSVEHGDLYFYINDNTYGIQNSYVKVLDKNAPTIDQDTLVNGWQEVNVDLTNLQRQNINEMGFYVSTQNGWDTSKGFSLNIDNIYLSTGNIYQTDGYIRFIYGSDFLYDFWRVRWEDIIPVDADSAGVALKVRTRVANSTSALPLAPWTDYYTTSGYLIPNPTSSMYKYIEIEFYFEASYTLNRSIVLKKVYLDFYAADTDFSFEYNTTEDWNSGYTFNIDTHSVANSITISNTDEIGNFYYGSDNASYQTDSGFNELNKITGSMLPRSTYQVLNGIQPSLGVITGVARGNNGNVWLSDIDNDRVIELDKSGTLVKGFMGSFLNPPSDVYEGETTTNPNSSTISVLHSIYNDGSLYIICSSDLENVYSQGRKLNLNNIYVKIGTHRLYFNNCEVKLLGVDNDKYELWKEIIGENIAEVQKINYFSFNSHVLQLELLDADRTLFDYLINQKMPSVVIYSPLEQEKKENPVTVKLLTYNFDLGTQVGEPSIRVTLDGATQIIYTTSVIFTGLFTGSHTLKVELLDATGTPYTNIEAVANSTFVTYSGTYSLPYMSILSPRPNQIYSSSPVTIEFDLKNFAIVPNGQHVQYIVDSEAPVDYYSSDPITLTDLDAGAHTFNIYVVDENGNALSYTYGSVTIDFIVGLNSNAVAKLYVENNAIYNNAGISCPLSRIDVDVCNMYLRNIYSPVDVSINMPTASNNNEVSILVAKLRSPSQSIYLSGQENVTEFIERIKANANSLATTSTGITINLNANFAGIETSDLIFDTGYLDGYSVVELDSEGNTIFSNNDAKIAPTKEVAKDILGSCEKIENGELLIADAWNKRAIITSTNVISRTSKIDWEYNSDRYVSDFHILVQDDIEIDIYDGSISEDSLYVRSGSTVTWINKSSAPISIYSGYTTYTIFNQNPDLNLYGDDFYSTVLQVGESYSYKFNSQGTYYWFVYPSILTGEILSFAQRVSDRDKFLILENDGLESPFSSRVIKIDNYGEVLWSFGQGYLIKPRDARSLLNGHVLIST